VPGTSYLCIKLALWQTLNAAGPVRWEEAHADLATALSHAVAVEELTAQVGHNAPVGESGVEHNQSASIKLSVDHDHTGYECAERALVMQRTLIKLRKL